MIWDYLVIKSDPLHYKEDLKAYGLKGWELVIILVITDITPGLVPNRPNIKNLYELIFKRSVINHEPSL